MVEAGKEFVLQSQTGEGQGKQHLKSYDQGANNRCRLHREQKQGRRSMHSKEL